MLEFPGLGWFKDLFARDDGLWAKMTWTPHGEEAITRDSAIQMPYSTERGAGRNPLHGRLVCHS